MYQSPTTRRRMRFWLVLCMTLTGVLSSHIVWQNAVERRERKRETQRQIAEMHQQIGEMQQEVDKLEAKFKAQTAEAEAVVEAGAKQAAASDR